jgi:hypothetical protein
MSSYLSEIGLTDQHTLSQAFKRNKLDNEDIQDLINLMAGKVIRYVSKHGNFDEVEYLVTPEKPKHSPETGTLEAIKRYNNDQ